MKPLKSIATTVHWEPCFNEACRINLGFFTATESAAVGVILVIILIFLKGDLTIKMLRDATWATIRTVGSLYLIVVGASMFNFLITVTQMPFTVVDFIDSLALTPLGIILVICAIYIHQYLQ